MKPIIFSLSLVLFCAVSACKEEEESNNTSGTYTGKEITFIFGSEGPANAFPVDTVEKSIEVQAWNDKFIIENDTVLLDAQGNFDGLIKNYRTEIHLADGLLTRTRHGYPIYKFEGKRAQ